MKWVAMLAQAFASALLLGLIANVRLRYWSIAAYLLVFSIATLIGFWELRAAGIGTSYKLFFAMTHLVLFALMAVIGWQVTAEFPAALRVWFFAGAFGFAFACVALGVWNRLDAAPLVFAALLFVGGQAALWGSASQEGVTRVLTFGLGVLWTVSSFYHYFIPFARAAHPETWRAANEWLPATLGFVIFAAMAFYVQAELSRAHAAEMDMEVAAARQEQVYERSAR